MIPKRPFGSTGVEVPILGQGTWQLRDRRAAAEALRAGVDLGMTHVDTAELYTGSEQVIREALSGRRNELFLVSKVLPRHASLKGTLDACEKSLQRLGTDHLDCYLLHWNDGSFPVSETMRAMGELVDSGKTPRQVALAFLSRDPSVFLIPKAERAEHARDNAGGAFELPKDVLAQIEEAFPMRPGLRFL